jgi:hypothetical protein
MRRVGVPMGKDRRKYRAQNSVVNPDFYSMKKLPEVSEKKFFDNAGGDFPVVHAKDD